MAPRVKSIQQLRRELVAREKQLEKIITQRGKLLDHLKSLDKQIATMGGKISGIGRGPGRPRLIPKAAARKLGTRRRATGTPLVEYIEKVLVDSKNGMRAKDIVQAVRKAGYKTYSKDFYGIVAAALRDNKCFKRIRRGVYTLVKPKKP